MKLVDVLANIEFEILKGTIDIDINGLQFDSRKIKPGNLFICIEGFNVDGHEFIDKALENGAKAIICQKKINVNIYKEDIAVIYIEDTRKAMAITAKNYFEHSDEKLKLIGITGTNGKTTSTYMLKKILEAAGFKVGVIGTIANYIGDKKIVSHRTTPEAIELHELFRDMVNEKVDYCVMEVSSHSLVLNRVYGLNFEEGIFTNLTQDHLDFHLNFENYYNAKKMLFINSKNSVINFEEKYGRRLLSELENNKVAYGISKECDVIASEIRMHSKGIDFRLNYNGKKAEVFLSMPGSFNLYNALCTASACLNEGVDIDIVAKGLSELSGVPGRCELASKNLGLNYDVILDYAHSPDSLLKTLSTVREFAESRVICVFGCGGDRDKTKRPEMGRIGTELSDYSIITSDNPRREEPMEIIQDIIKGVNKENYEVIENRKEAIRKAMNLARKGDVVLIAGKGHEDYQELKNGTIHFDEREIISQILKEANS